MSWTCCYPRNYAVFQHLRTKVLTLTIPTFSTSETQRHLYGDEIAALGCMQVSVWPLWADYNTAPAPRQKTNVEPTSDFFVEVCRDASCMSIYPGVSANLSHGLRHHNRWTRTRSRPQTTPCTSKGCQRLPGGRKSGNFSGTIRDFIELEVQHSPAFLVS